MSIYTATNNSPINNIKFSNGKSTKTFAIGYNDIANFRQDQYTVSDENIDDKNTLIIKPPINNSNYIVSKNNHILTRTYRIQFLIDNTLIWPYLNIRYDIPELINEDIFYG